MLRAKLPPSYYCRWAISDWKQYQTLDFVGQGLNPLEGDNSINFESCTTGVNSRSALYSHCKRETFKLAFRLYW